MIYIRRKIFFKTYIYFVLLSSYFFSSCEKNQLQNKNIPPSVDEPFLAASEEQKFLDEKWKTFASAFHIPTDDISLTSKDLNQLAYKSLDAIGEEKLIGQLSTPSGFLVDPSKAASYEKLLMRIQKDFAKNAYKSRCAKIVGFSKFSDIKIMPKEHLYGEPSSDYLIEDKDDKDLSVGSVYKLQYQLIKDIEGSHEKIVRTGLISIPNDRSKRYPILAYAHGGDRGLSYLEVASMLDHLQRSHIVMAPTYPNEPWCEGVGAGNNLCDAKGYVSMPVGKGGPWDSDVDELLGMHHCLTQTIAEDRFPAPRFFRELLRASYQPIRSHKSVGGLARLLAEAGVQKLQKWADAHGALFKQGAHFFAIEIADDDSIEVPKSKQALIIKEVLSMAKEMMIKKSINSHNSEPSSYKELITTFLSQIDLGQVMNHAVYFPFIHKVLLEIDLNFNPKSINDFIPVLTEVIKKILSDDGYKKHMSLILDRLGLSQTGLLKFDLSRTPASMIVGASRGGMVAGIALAKIGAQFAELSRSLSVMDFERLIEREEPFWKESLGASFGGLPQSFSCATSISAPSSILIGRLRIVLEYMIKGHFEYTKFSLLPGLRKLKDLLDEYRLDRTHSNKILKKGVLAIAKRDVPLLGPFIFTSLKNWNRFDVAELRNPSAHMPMGAYLYLHGDSDKVVPVEQAIFAFNVLYAFSNHPVVLVKTRSQISKLVNKKDVTIVKDRSINLTYRSFRAPEGSDQKPNFHHHLDGFFLSSSSYIPANLIPENNHSFAFYAHRKKADLFNQEDRPLKEAAEYLYIRALARDDKSKEIASQFFQSMPPTDPSYIKNGRLAVAAGQLVGTAMKINEKTGDVDDVSSHSNEHSDPRSVFLSWRYNQCAAVLDE